MTTARQVPEDDLPDEHGVTPAFQRANPPLRFLAKAENALIIALLVSTVGVILAQVFWRYALDRPLSWSNEIATDLLVYVAFVGFAIGVRDNSHVALHLFERRLSKRGQTGLRIVELIVLAIVIVSVGVGGAWYAYEQRDVTSPIDVPLWIPFAALPLGGLLGAVHIVVELVALARGASATPRAVTSKTGATTGGVA